MLCPNCRKQISDSAVFCTRCGQRIYNNNTEPTDAEKTTRLESQPLQEAAAQGQKQHRQVAVLVTVSIFVLALLTAGIIQIVKGLPKQTGTGNEPAPGMIAAGTWANESSMQAETYLPDITTGDNEQTEAETAPEQIYIEDLRGYSAEELERYFSFSGIIIRAVSEYSQTVSEGCIIGTYPEAGGYLTKGDTLTAYISLGPEVLLHSYRLFHENCTWDEARQNCIDMGGHLVTINSYEEEEYILDMVTGAGAKYVWLGGYTQVDAYGNVNGAWVTGEPMDYEDWLGPNEPSGVDIDGTRESCIMLWHVQKYENYGLPGYNGWGWNDNRSDLSEFSNYTDNLYYICEFDDTNKDVNER